MGMGLAMNLIAILFHCLALRLSMASEAIAAQAVAVAGGILRGRDLWDAQSRLDCPLGWMQAWPALERLARPLDRRVAALAPTLAWRGPRRPLRPQMEELLGRQRYLAAAPSPVLPGHEPLR